jgi:hypothetical protein
MNQLVPCPECSRHVRQSESACPFCGQALSLAHLPPPAMPRRRLGRAATFAFGASVVGATALVACSDDDPGGAVAVYGAPPAAGTSNGGSSAGETSNGGSSDVDEPEGGTAGMTAIYGGPPEAGAGGQAGATPSDGAGGEARAVYGGPPGGDGNL